MKKPDWTKDHDAQAFLREAEALGEAKAASPNK